MRTAADIVLAISVVVHGAIGAGYLEIGMPGRGVACLVLAVFQLVVLLLYGFRYPELVGRKGDR